MGTLRITIELDTEAIDENWGRYAGRAAQQLLRAVSSNSRLAAIWPHRTPGDWDSRPVVVTDRKLNRKTVGQIVVDRSDTGWDS